MNPDVHVLADAASAAAACAARIAELIAQAVSARGRATLAVSGGSTPRMLFQELTRLPVNWTGVHLFWADERCVPPEDAESNYRLAREFLISPAAIPPENVHRIRGELEPGTAAEECTREIRRFFQTKPGTLPRLDIVQLGMGPDTHTASLFPGQPAVADRTGIAAAVEGPKPPPWRVTLLPGVLLAAHSAVFLVAGEDKASAMQQVLHGPYDPLQRPAQLIAREAHAPEWFVDAPAASSL